MPLMRVVSVSGLAASGALKATRRAWLKFGSLPASSGKVIQRASIAPVGSAGANVTTAVLGAVMATEKAVNAFGGPVSIGGLSIVGWPICWRRVLSETYIDWPLIVILDPRRSMTGFAAA